MQDGTSERDGTGEQHRRLIARSRILLASVAETLADLLRRIRAGEPRALKGLAAKHAELETALRRAEEIEGRYDAWRAARGGDVPGEIDLDAARGEIGRRLDRLRAARGSGDVSG